MYTSAWAFFDELIRERGWRDTTPNYFLPVDTSNSVYGLVFSGLQSQYTLTTAGGKGAGRAIVVDDLYCTEMQEWGPSAAEAAEQLDTFMSAAPPGSGARTTVDFNASDNWQSSHAYTVWDNAGKDHDDPEWNGFTQFFIGTDDLPEWYTPEVLEIARQKASSPKRFQLDYPRRIEDLYVQSERSVHDAAIVKAATESEYAGSTAGLRILHGVDTATGREDGDYQVCVTVGWDGSRWREVCAPLRLRVPEEVFAAQVDARVRQYAGTCVVERNVGSAVLTELRRLETPNLYKHKHRDKAGRQRRELGFPTTSGTKRVMIADLDRMLRDGEIGLTTPELIQEVREVEWKTTDAGKDHSSQAGAPDRAGAHDDLWMGLMLALQGINYDTSGAWGA